MPLIEFVKGQLTLRVWQSLDISKGLNDTVKVISVNPTLSFLGAFIRIFSSIKCKTFTDSGGHFRKIYAAHPLTFDQRVTRNF
jgi:hypothetical protein